MLITIANFLFKCNIKHVPIRVVQGNFNLGWPKIISCHITTTVTTALLLLHKMLECFIFFRSSPFQIYHAFLEENRLWKSLGNSILFGIRRWVLNFFRNKALIVSQLKRFLAWFNSTTWNIISEIWCVVRTRKTGRENCLSQRSIFQTLQASLLSFYEMFHGYCIILACIFHFYIFVCTLHKT